MSGNISAKGGSRILAWGFYPLLFKSSIGVERFSPVPFFSIGCSHSHGIVRLDHRSNNNPTYADLIADHYGRAAPPLIDAVADKRLGRGRRPGSRALARQRLAQSDCRGQGAR